MTRGLQCHESIMRPAGTSSVRLARDPPGALGACAEQRDRYLSEADRTLPLYGHVTQQNGESPLSSLPRALV